MEQTRRRKTYENKFSSRERSFLILALSLGSSKQAGQFSFITGRLLARANWVSSDSLVYDKGRITASYQGRQCTLFAITVRASFGKVKWLKKYRRRQHTYITHIDSVMSLHSSEKTVMHNTHHCAFYCVVEMLC